MQSSVPFKRAGCVGLGGWDVDVVDGLPCAMTGGCGAGRRVRSRHLVVQYLVQYVTLRYSMRRAGVC